MFGGGLCGPAFGARHLQELRPFQIQAGSGVHAGNEPVAFDFDEGGFDVLGVALGGAGELADGGELGGGVGLGGGVDEDVDAIEGDVAGHARAGGHEGLLEFGFAVDGVGSARDAFEVDDDVACKVTGGAIDGGDAGDVAFVGFGGEGSSEFFEADEDDFFGRGVEPLVNEEDAGGRRGEQNDLQNLPHASERNALDTEFQRLPRAARFGSSYWMRRELLQNVNRLVVKLGTGVLTDAKKQPDMAQLEQLVEQIARQRKAGREVTLVTSGAVGAGMGILGHAKRPAELAELQACAAVGQSRLMSTYEKLFAKHDLNVAQVLLTHADLEHHDRHLNARNTLVRLLQHGVIPIINENDAVSFTELKFGDNDKLSALVACLLPADLLVILTTVDGVIENFGKANAELRHTIEAIDESIEASATGTTSATAVGGMTSKIDAAKIVIRSGIPLVIASGRKKSVLEAVTSGKEEGTLFVPKASKLGSRKRWIAFYNRPAGSLFVDDGAKKALREKGRSLLLPGVVRCEGNFKMGDVVSIRDANGTEFARGVAKAGSAAICEKKLAKADVVHRDNLVIL